jgi:plastocyanin
MMMALPAWGRATLGLLLIAAAPLPANAGDIVGTIVFTRQVTRKTLAPANYAMRGVVPRASTRVESPEGSHQVAVWLENDATRPGKPVRATLVQRDRRFEPDMLIVPVGSVVSFPNADPIFHNVFSLSKAHEFDLGYYLANKSPSVMFDRSGVVQIYCHLHPNMYAAIIVVPGAYYARSSGDGTFTLTGIPAGKWRLVAWHRTAGLFRRTIQVPAHGEVEVKLELPEREGESNP